MPLFTTSSSTISGDRRGAGEAGNNNGGDATRRSLVGGFLDSLYRSAARARSFRISPATDGEERRPQRSCGSPSKVEHYTYNRG